MKKSWSRQIKIAKDFVAYVMTGLVRDFFSFWGYWAPIYGIENHIGPSRVSEQHANAQKIHVGCSVGSLILEGGLLIIKCQDVVVLEL
jgi:hypothetical protein